MASSSVSDYGVDEAALSLIGLLQGTLDKVVSIYASYNMPLPGRQYWTLGAPAFDCEQVTVNLVQMYLGEPGNEAALPVPCNAPRSAVLEIAVVRTTAVPNSQGKPPSPEAIIQHAEFLAADSMILMDSIKQFDSWGIDEDPILAGLPGLGVIATLEARPAEGGYHAIVLQLTLAVP